MPRSRRRVSRRVVSVLAALVAGGVDLLVWAGDDELRWGGSVPPWAVPAATALAVAALVVRRRAPLAVFAGLWVLGLAGLAMPKYAPFACLLVALHGLAAKRPARVATPAALALAVPFGINVANFVAAATPERRPALLVANAAAWAVLVLTAYSLGRITYAADRRAELLQELRVRDAAEAQQAERLRLARELHDVVSHAVTAMLLQAAGARTLTDREGRVGTALGAIETSGRRAMAELHEMLTLLRQVPAGDGAVPAADHAGVARIPALVEEAPRMDLHVRHCVTGEPAALDPEPDLAAYRVVQEALTNAAKHAGPGADVAVDLAWSPARLLVTVTSTPDPARRDADPGPALPSSGRGLAGLAERVALAGGHLRTRAVGPAFELCAELPTRWAAGAPGRRARGTATPRPPG